MQPVAYSGAVLIPFCIGSIAIPLAAPLLAEESLSRARSPAGLERRGGAEAAAGARKRRRPAPERQPARAAGSALTEPPLASRSGRGSTRSASSSTASSTASSAGSCEEASEGGEHGDQSDSPHEASEGSGDTDGEGSRHPTDSDTASSSGTEGSSGAEVTESRGAAPGRAPAPRPQAPLHARRHATLTHRRYCYLRDGSSLADDRYYRCWLEHHQHHHLTPAEAAATGGGSARLPPLCPLCGTGGDLPGVSGPAAFPYPFSSPSLLYSLVDYVVFRVDKSFDTQVRVATRPPFFIEDDTWAEHLVEVEIVFRPGLHISSVKLHHAVHLQRRASFPPALVAATLGKDKPSPTVILTRFDSCATDIKPLLADETSEGVLGRGSTPPRGGGGSAEWLANGLVIVERRDAIRISHPTVLLLQVVALFYQKWGQFQSRMSAETALLDQLLAGHAHGEDASVAEPHALLTGPERGLRRLGRRHLPFLFPFEWVIQENEAIRVRESMDAMDSVYEALFEEQRDTLRDIHRAMHSCAELSDAVAAEIERLRDRCERMKASPSSKHVAHA